MGVIGLAAAALALDCETPTDRAAVGRAVEDVEAAWESMDAAGVVAADARLRSAVVCIAEPLLPAEVAGFWRATAYARYIARDVDGAGDALRAARAVQPAYSLPSHIAGETHPLRALWTTAAPRLETLTALGPPADGWLLVDGRRATSAPDARPYVFQHVAETGAIHATAIEEAGAVPQYPPRPAPVAIVAPVEPAVRHTSRGLLAGGLATAAAGGAAMVGAYLTEIEYDGTPLKEGPLPGLRTANHVLFVSGIGLTAAGSALCLRAVILHRW